MVLYFGDNGEVSVQRIIVKLEVLFKYKKHGDVVRCSLREVSSKP